MARHTIRQMSVSPRTPAHAVLHAALRGDVAHARPHFGTGLAALILTLLLRLLARTEAAWTLPHDESDSFEHTPHALIMPPIGRAPHAAVIEAGLVPDWILPGIRNRGMRPAAIPARLRPRARPARAPPVSCSTATLKTPPFRGRRLTPILIAINQ